MKIDKATLGRQLTRTPLAWIAAMIAATVAAYGVHGATWLPQRIVCLLALPSLLGLVRPVWLRETGLLLARSGVVVSLLVAQLEAGGSDSGRFQRAGVWLAMALGFAVLVLVIHLVAHTWRAEDEARRQALEQARHEEILSAIRAVAPTAATHTKPPGVAQFAAGVLVALLVRRR